MLLFVVVLVLVLILFLAFLNLPMRFLVEGKHVKLMAHRDLANRFANIGHRKGLAHDSLTSNFGLRLLGEDLEAHALARLAVRGERLAIVLP